MSRMSISRFKLLVVDIDGTLINKAGSISKTDIEALTRVTRAGIRVSLSTGRVSRACLGILDSLSLDGYHVFSDGAVVAEPRSGEEVYIEAIPQGIVKEIIDFVREGRMRIDLFSPDHYFVECEDWVTDIRQNFFSLDPTVVNFDHVWEQERITKATLVVRSLEEKSRAGLFLKHFNEHLNFSWTRTPAYPDVDFINVIGLEVSKGKALEELAAFLKISLSDVAAIGDGANDISLLSSAGLGIAMDNGPEDLKSVARYVVPDVEHNGVAVAVEKYVLQGE